MKNLITGFITFGLIIAISQYSYGAKTYLKITPDNTVFTKGQVQVEQSEDKTIKKIVTLNALTTERQVLVTLIADKQAYLVTLDALIVSVDIEASKALLKVPE